MLPEPKLPSRSLSENSNSNPTTEELQDTKKDTQNQVVKGNFNYYITKFFINNTRLTVLLFVLLLIIGSVATFSLKTTGFPNPEIKLAIIQTIYPGASSKTVAEEVTKPIENSIKSVDGVKQFSSTSTNNASIISVQLNEDASTDTVRNQLDTAVNGVTLPDGVQDPKIIKPEVSGPAFIYSITAPSEEKIYNIYSEFNKDINSLSDTSTVEPFTDLEKVVEVTLNESVLLEKGIDPTQIQYQLSNINRELPVQSNKAIENTDKIKQNYSIVTSLSGGQSIEQIRDLEFVPTPKNPSQQSPESGSSTENLTTQTPSTLTPSQPDNTNLNATQPNITPVKLSEIATVEYAYKWSDDLQPVISINKENKGQAIRPLVLVIRTVAGADQGAYERLLTEKIEEYDDVELIKGEQVNEIDASKSYIIENYSINVFNDRQVEEVISGLVGGKLDIADQVNKFSKQYLNIDNSQVGDSISNVGWLLGGIQLVFLVMLAFVSWRAALIAAFSIPLSLVFSTIFLYFIGESLNTLVLFSLVLVIGLVVDPALVILESIQRKIDIGLKGKEAALEAVKDVGNGLFLATLTNIIVFAPFGVISGVLGQIFSYIPLTVISATIGSYIVPLVFLSWLGGLILKPSKSTSDDEEKNLWPIARGLINLNKRILSGNPFVKIVIILAGLIIPLGITGYLFQTGQLKSAQFATNDNGDFVVITGSFLPSVTTEQKTQALEQTLALVASDQDVYQVFPIGNGINYYAELKPINSRERIAIEIADEFNQKLIDQFGDKSSSPVFFDVSVQVEQNGPPASTYQVAISVKTDDLDKLKTAALDVDKTLQKVCFNNTTREISLDEKCSDGKKIVTKIDNGYTGKTNKSIEIILDRNLLTQNGLIDTPNPSNPQSFIAINKVNSILKGLFNDNEINELSTISVNGEDVKVVLNNEVTEPKSIEEITSTVVGTNNNEPITLGEIARIQEITPPSVIERVEGETIGVVNARLTPDESDEGTAARVTSLVENYYAENNGEKTTNLGLAKEGIIAYSEGGSEGFARSFTELLTALVLAIFLTYVVLAVFFRSFLQPIVVLYTIPLTFVGMMPALAYLGGGEIGFLEIIGIIILIGVVENVAIFLIDSARQKIDEEGWDYKSAIAYASGVRFRPVLLTKFTAIASLAPLAILSIFYRSISITIMFGLLSSGFVSLITTPILFTFFKWSSDHFHKAVWQIKISSLAFVILTVGAGCVAALFSTYFSLDSALIPPILGISSLIGLLITIGIWIYWVLLDRKLAKK